MENSEKALAFCGRAKVVLLGDDAGLRSAIVHRLINDGQLPSSTEPPKKRAIEISSKTYTYNNKQLTIDFWNVNEQQAFLDLPQFIFSDEALYIVVQNGKENLRKARTTFWMDTLRKFAPQAIALQFVNTDEPFVDEPNSLHLIAQRAVALPSLSVQHTSPADFQKHFTDRLLSMLQSRLGDAFSSDEEALLNALEQHSNSIITIGKFENLCCENGVNYHEYIQRQLCAMGTAFWIDAPKLANYIILRPQWLIHALSAILYDASQRTGSGGVLHRSLAALLKNIPGADSYRAEDLPYILGVMRYYALSIQLQDSSEFIHTQCRITDSGITEDYRNDQDTLRFAFTFDIPAELVLRRLMSQRKNELDQDRIWRGGGRFIHPELSLSAVAYTRTNTLHLFVRSRNVLHSPHIYLALLRSSLDVGCKQLGLSSPSCEIIYETDGRTARLDYDALLTMREDGQTAIYVNELRKLVPIAEILGDHSQQTDTRTTKLLADMAKAFVSMQENPHAWEVGEEDKNTFLGQYLIHQRYTVRDQAMDGIFTSRAQNGSLDLLICNADGHPWALCESLRVSSGRDLRRWNDHLTKLLTHKQNRTCSILFLVSYAECETSDFPRLWSVFNDHMRDYQPDYGRRIGAYQHILPLQEQQEFLRVAQCSYDIGGTAVTVYHYFVRIGPTAPDSTESELHEQIKDYSAEIERLKQMLNRERQDREAAETAARSARDELENMARSTHKQIQQLEAELASKQSSPFWKIFAHAQKTPEDETEEKQDAQKPVTKEYRVMIMGDSEAGKSQILHRLRHPKQDPKTFAGDVTPGIDIASRCYDIGGEWVRVNFWDFGGQEVLHSLHRLFLSTNTMYVIVLNTRNDNQEEQARFWLNYVTLYATGAPVLLVLNKIDQNPTATLNMPALQRAFRHTADIQGFLRLSAREWDQTQFENTFLKRVHDLIKANMDESHSFSAEELQVRDMIRGTHGDQQIIDISDFRTVCKKAGLPKEYNCIDLANRFHRAGMFVYFQTRSNMILNPDWITSAIYKILEHGSSRSSNGIIDYETIENIFYEDETAEYTKAQIDFVMKVMRLYGLSFPYQPQGHDAQEREFIPMLCKREEPTDFDAFIMDENVVQMQLVFSYLPSGILYQLVTALHLDSQNGLLKAKDFHVWISGIMFETDDGCRAAVVKEQNRMHFYVRCDNRMAAISCMDMLRNLVEVECSSNLYIAQIRQRLLGYSIAGKVEFFDYDRLSLAKAHDLSYVISKYKPGPLFVQDVLDQKDGAQVREQSELLRLILRGAREVQEDPNFWKMDEDGKNREIARAIKTIYNTEEQKQSGLSESRKGIGELDILIKNSRGFSFAILEALITPSINTINWKNHLDKLMENYNPSGLPTLILVSYVTSCPKEKFAEKFGNTLDHWKKLSPTGYDGCFRGVDTFHTEDCPELIHITRAEYVRNQFTTSLYHFMIYIGDPPAESK